MSISKFKKFNLKGLIRSSDDDKPRSLTSYVFASLIVIGFSYLLFPWLIPFKFLQFWHTTGDMSTWLNASKPIFLWAFCVTALSAILTRNKRSENRDAEKFLFSGSIISISAGVLEETIFRWLLFFALFAGLAFSNFLFFGWLGFGIAEFLQNHFFGPVANFFTLGMLKPQLLGQNWLIGAALLTANTKFRDGHIYLGPFGYVNSWFIGMFMFWLMFKFGLPACIICHFLYDLIIFAVGYVDRVFERTFLDKN